MRQKPASSRRFGRCVMTAFLLLLAVVPAVAVDTPALSEKELKAAIERLNSPKFEDRERAAEELVAAGVAGLPLLEAAVGTAPPEAAARSLEILDRLYVRGSDEQFDAVEKHLVKLSKNPEPEIRDRAASILDLAADRRTRLAVAAIERMGALAKETSARGAMAMARAEAKPGRISIDSILITRAWTGGDAGLDQVRRLYHLPILRIYRIRGASVSDEAIEQLDADLANVSEIQTRGAGCLGISATVPAANCSVSGVAKGSAAEKAGLEPEDIVIRFGDDEVRSFQDLIDLLYDKEPGQKIPLVYLRGGEEMTVTVELTDWK